MRREEQLVVALCRTPLPQPARETADALITIDLNWDRVFMFAALFEVEPVFFSNLRSLTGSEIPAEVLDRAAIVERDSRALALSRTLLLVDLYRKLERIGIPVIVLKGPALGAMAYGDPSMRTYQDIDFLTTREYLPRARDLLLGVGYKRDYDADSESLLLAGDHALEFSGPGSKVELHCALVERHLRFDLGGDELWNEASTVECAGAKLKVLDRARLLLFVCAHGTKHEWTKFRWICDVAQLADRIDDNDARKVVALAARAHATRILSLGLGLAREILGQDLSLFSSLFPARDRDSSRESESTFSYVRHRLGLGEAVSPGDRAWIDRVDSDAASLLFWARSRERWVDRVASVARVVFVPTEKDRKMGALGWITRPFRLAARLVRRAVAA